jgi:hypothetical protein
VALLWGHRAVKPPLTGDHDTFRDIPKNRIAGSLKGSPGAGATSSSTLPPNHLSTQKETDFLKDVCHVSRQGSVRAPPKVGDVDCYTTTRFENTLAFFEDLA